MNLAELEALFNRGHQIEAFEKTMQNFKFIFFETKPNHYTNSMM